MSYAAVFPLVRTRAFSEAFDYEIPRELTARAVPGALAAVPLGAQTVIGVILEVREHTAHEGRVLPLRDVLRVPPIPAELLGLARRIEEHYLTSFSGALALVCPPTGALKIVRQYDLTDAGRAAAAAGEHRLLELAGLRLRSGPGTPEAEELPAQGLAARRLHRARRRRHGAGSLAAPRAGDARTAWAAAARGARAPRRRRTARGARTARRQRSLGRGTAPSGRGAAVLATDAERTRRHVDAGEGWDVAGPAGRSTEDVIADPAPRRPAACAAAPCSPTSPTCWTSSAVRCTASSARRTPATRSCCTASPAAARPRSTSRRRRPRWTPAARSCSSCPRSA